MAPSSPKILFCLDHPTIVPTTATVAVSGWIASPWPIRQVRVGGPGGTLSDPLRLVDRPGMRDRHPEMAHVAGFSDRIPAVWASNGEIELVYTCGDIEERSSRELPYGVDMNLKAKKLLRIASVLRPDRNGRLNGHHFDFLTDELREDYDIIEVDAVSSNGYDGIALDLIRRHADGLVLDAGAGLRSDYLPNVVNYEIVPYPSTDVLGVGEDLPFVDDCFDAVLSLAVLEHVKDPFACARELARVLKPGGTLYAAVPFLQPYHGYPHHYYNMTHQGLANLFSENLIVKEQHVLESGHPLRTLRWFLRSYCEGLPPAEREAFKRRAVADFLGEPAELLKQDFALKLSENAQFELAATTMLIATKP